MMLPLLEKETAPRSSHKLSSGMWVVIGANAAAPDKGRPLASACSCSWEARRALEGDFCGLGDLGDFGAFGCFGVLLVAPARLAEPRNGSAAPAPGAAASLRAPAGDPGDPGRCGGSSSASSSASGSSAPPPTAAAAEGALSPPSIFLRNLFDPSGPMPKLLLSLRASDVRRVGELVGELTDLSSSS